MTLTTVSRKQRLRTLENDIRERAEDIQKNGLEIGRDLCEIRDDELWKGDEKQQRSKNPDDWDWPSWNQYLKERAGELVGKSFGRAQFLIDMTEVADRLPVKELSSPGTGITPKHLKEIKRLAPTDEDDERKKDLSKLRKQDVARVLDRAREISGGDTPSVRDVQKAVDEDLGIDRAAQAAKTREERSVGPDLDQYLRDTRGRLQGILGNLQKIPDDGWKLLEEEQPGLMTSVIDVCETLAELLRSKQERKGRTR